MPCLLAAAVGTRHSWTPALKYSKLDQQSTGSWGDLGNHVCSPPVWGRCCTQLGETEGLEEHFCSVCLRDCSVPLQGKVGERLPERDAFSRGFLKGHTSQSTSGTGTKLGLFIAWAMATTSGGKEKPPLPCFCQLHGALLHSCVTRVWSTSWEGSSSHKMKAQKHLIYVFCRMAAEAFLPLTGVMWCSSAGRLRGSADTQALSEA